MMEADWQGACSSCSGRLFMHTQDTAENQVGKVGPKPKGKGRTLSDNVKPTHTHANKHTHPPVDNSIN